MIHDKVMDLPLPVLYLGAVFLIVLAFLAGAFWAVWRMSRLYDINERPVSREEHEQLLQNLDKITNSKNHAKETIQTDPPEAP